MPQEGSPYLSVTQVLEDNGLGRYSNSNIPHQNLEIAGNRGVGVDLAAQNYFEFGQYIIDKDYQPFMDAFELAVEQLEIQKPMFSQLKMRSHLLRCDGILDFFTRTIDGDCLIDLKTGEPSGRHPDGRKYDHHHAVDLQTIGYKIIALSDPNTPNDPMGTWLKLALCKRRALYLLKNGSYRWFHLDNDDEDEQVFRAALTLSNYRRVTA